MGNQGVVPAVVQTVDHLPPRRMIARTVRAARTSKNHPTIHKLMECKKMRNLRINLKVGRLNKNISSLRIKRKQCRL